MFTESVSVQTQTTTLNRYLSSIFGWMIVAMTLSGIAAFAIYASPALQDLIFGSPIVYYGIIIGELIAVFTLSMRAQKLSMAPAFILFAIYSILTGLTLSIV